jgi:thiol-disulfide isomerase/thioredoxin
LLLLNLLSNNFYLNTMKKNLFWATILLAATHIHAQTAFMGNPMTVPGGIDEKKGLTITGTFQNAAVPEVVLYEYDGVGHTAIAKAPFTKAASGYTFELVVPKKLPQGVYFIGSEVSNIRTIVLCNDKTNKDVAIAVMGNDAAQFRTAGVAGAASNAVLDYAMNRMGGFNQAAGGAVMEFRAAGGDSLKMKPATEKLRAIDAQKLAFIDSLKNVDKFAAACVATRTYISWYYNKKGYADEIQYFANEYFQLNNFAAIEPYNYMPMLNDAFKEYVQTLTMVGLDPKAARTLIDKNLARIPQNSRAYKMALAGIWQAYAQKEPNNFTYYGEAWLAKYKTESPAYAPALEAALGQVRSQVVGGAAPEIKLATPEGGEFGLSQLKGKVVLIDFWASWCGPCRRAFPEVKATYAKYRSRNFEILGVSLDRDKDAWLGAIKSDDLPWKQISDLKFWQCQGAVTYGVTSIPQTVLVDKKGNIAARNLMGAQLDQKIEELLKE